jgi:excisionase family DNA binding protein
MQDEVTTTDDDQGEVAPRRAPEWRGALRNGALQNALRKRKDGVPTFSVPEAAALLSVSQEHLYRLIQAGVFPAVRLGMGGKQGRYVVPATAVEDLLATASAAGACIDAGEWTQAWQSTRPNKQAVA